MIEMGQTLMLKIMADQPSLSEFNCHGFRPNKNKGLLLFCAKTLFLWDINYNSVVFSFDLISVICVFVDLIDNLA